MTIKITQRVTFVVSMNFLSSSLDMPFVTVKGSLSYNIIK